LIVTSADPNLPLFGQRGSLTCIGYMRSIAIQGTALVWGCLFHDPWSSDQWFKNT